MLRKFLRFALKHNIHKVLMKQESKNPATLGVGVVRTHRL